MITSLIEILATKLWPHEHIYNIICVTRWNFIGDVMDIIMRSYILFQNIVSLRRSGMAVFADIIKIVTMFIKTIFKDSKLKELEVMYQIPTYICISWYSKIC